MPQLHAVVPERPRHESRSLLGAAVGKDVIERRRAGAEDQGHRRFRVIGPAGPESDIARELCGADAAHSASPAAIASMSLDMPNAFSTSSIVARLVAGLPDSSLRIVCTCTPTFSASAA